MVTVPPVIPARISPPAVSLNRTLPAPLVEAKEVTALFCVLSVMALPAALTLSAPPLMAPDWLTAPAAVTVMEPVALIAPRMSVPVESLMTTLLPLVTATVPRLLVPVRLMPVLAPVAVRVVAVIGPANERACPTVRVVMKPETAELDDPVIVPAAADSVVVPLRPTALSMAPALIKAISPAVAVIATVLPVPVVLSRPLMVTVVPMIVMSPSVV